MDSYISENDFGPSNQITVPTGYNGYRPQRKFVVLRIKMLPMGGRLPKVIEQGATLSTYPEENSSFFV